MVDLCQISTLVKYSLNQNQTWYLLAATQYNTRSNLSVTY